MIRDANFETNNSNFRIVYESNSNAIEFNFEFNENDFDCALIDAILNVDKFLNIHCVANENKHN